MTEQRFNAPLKAIETIASDALKIYGLPSGQPMPGPPEYAPRLPATREGLRIRARGQSNNLHSAHSLDYYCSSSPYYAVSSYFLGSKVFSGLRYNITFLGPLL